MLPAPEGEDLPAYCGSLLDRYRNPAIRHRTWQIAMDGSQKLPQRLLGTISDRLAAGTVPQGLCLAVAGWMRYVAGTDEAGDPIDVRDPIAERLKAAANSADPVASLLAIGSVFDRSLADDDEFVASVRARPRQAAGRGLSRRRCRLSGERNGPSRNAISGTLHAATALGVAVAGSAAVMYVGMMWHVPPLRAARHDAGYGLRVGSVAMAGEQDHASPAAPLTLSVSNSCASSSARSSSSIGLICSAEGGYRSFADRDGPSRCQISGFGAVVIGRQQVAGAAAARVRAPACH